mmetsp:Transcript_24011/g.26280  ORF Transcript_24011/g.26280 Transcript_24011/m.26280 type:complete len:292 (+) Transcript_24011:473-1348(+)
MELNYKQLLKEERERIRRELLNKDSKDAELPKSKSEIEKTRECDNTQVLGKYQILSVVDHAFHLAKLNGNIEQFRLNAEQSSIYYIPNILDNEYADYLLNQINNMKDSWTFLRTRRLQHWGKKPKDIFSRSNDKSLETSFMPSWLDTLIDQVVERGIFSPEIRPNNVLINQYEPNEGILHHTDGPSYHNRVAIFSLESTCIMTFKPKLTAAQIGLVSDKDVLSLVLKPLSLLIFSDDLYDSFMHGIYPDEPFPVVGQIAPCVNLQYTDHFEGDQIVRGRRTSITIRRVVDE